jgi:hypothetical protein
MVRSVPRRRPGKKPARTAGTGNAAHDVFDSGKAEDVLEAQEGEFVMLMGKTDRVVAELDFVAAGDVAVPVAVAEPVGTGALASIIHPPEEQE